MSATYSGKLYFPNLTKGLIWSCDSEIGEISRWQVPEKEAWRGMTSADNRPHPKIELAIIDEVGEPPNDKLVFFHAPQPRGLFRHAL
jgi:hypothetical protein